MKHFQDADVEPGEMARWQGTGAVAAALAAGPMPHLHPTPVEPNLTEALQGVEKMAADARERVAGLRYTLTGEGQPWDTGPTGESITARLNVARVTLADILGDLASIETALGIREV